MSFDCQKCGAKGGITSFDDIEDFVLDEDLYPPNKCTKCGWIWKPRWHDNPNLPSTEFIALCIVIIISLFYFFW